MPKCVRCEDFFPPQFCKQMTTHPNDPNAVQCVFCEKNMDHIELKDGSKYTKQKCIEEYKLLTKMLAEKKGIAEKLIKGKIDLGPKPGG